MAKYIFPKGKDNPIHKRDVSGKNNPMYGISLKGEKHPRYNGIDKKIDKFIEDNKDKHLCQCKCGGYIDIKKHHYYYGIPKYRYNHHNKGKNNYFFGKILVGKNNGNYKGRKKPYCICCEKEISYSSIWCKSCARKAERNPNWNNGSSFKPYPLGWTKTFKEQIRYRDGYQCQLCGVPELETGRRLDVHHIDYSKHNLKEDNLISLCQSCHRRTNYNREYWLNLLQNTMKKGDK